jgi:Zn-dependent peptidase ImmA (M78 family)
MTAMVQLRRGFVTWCENAAKGYRRDLGLRTFDALDPRKLAALLGITILFPAEIPGVPKASLHQLLNKDPDSWSAVTLILEAVAVIILNSTHKITRLNSDLAHELSHLILKHKPAQMFVTADGKMVMNHYDAVHEEEAGRLSGILLVPREGLMHLCAQGCGDAEMANHFGVSEQLLVMRKNMSGIVRQMGHRRKHRPGGYVSSR